VSAGWLEQRERGGLLAMRTAARVLLGVGHAFGRLLLYPVCLYFVVFSRQARAASRDDLSRVLGRPAGVRDVARHYLTFARTLQDRVYFLAGRTAEYNVEQHGAEAVELALAKGKGCLLLGAHIGSFEVLRVVGARERRLPVNAAPGARKHRARRNRRRPRRPRAARRPQHTLRFPGRRGELPAGTAPDRVHP
jgi:predicted LPLAT superfamily acyltransferase